MRPLKFGLFQATYSTHDMVEIGVQAEKHGFHSVMMGDHFLDLSGLVKIDPWTVLATIGAKTKRIRLTTYVTDVLRTHPTKVAHIAATLDELTHGRVSVGLGAGEAMNLVPFGIGLEPPETRLERLREGIQVIKALWSSSKSKRVNFQGKFYRLRDAWMQQQPTQKLGPPILIGALGASRMLRLVGEIGDGWVPAYSSLELFEKRVRIIKEAAVSNGRDPNSIEYTAPILGVMTKEQKTKKKALQAYKSLLLSLAPKYIRRVGLPESVEVDPTYSYQQVIPGDKVVKDSEALAMGIPDELVEKFLVIGGAEDLVEGVDHYRKAGATSILFWDMVAEGLLNSIPVAVKNMRIFRENVASHFNQR